jgi:ligand-binding sensor domain-containing protein
MKNYITIFLLLTGFSLAGHAQSALWTSYLKPSRVNDYLDEPDKLYLATDAGIFVFDKITRLMTHWSKATHGLPSNQVESIARHPETGVLFIGTYDIALAFRQGDTWNAIPYPEEIQGQSLSGMRVYCIEFDNEGQLWVGTDHGLLKYNGTQWDLINSSDPQEFMHQVWDIHREEDGGLLIASNVLYRYDGNEFEPLFSLDFSSTENLFAYSNALMHKHSDGSIWFFNDVGRAGRFDGESWQVFDSSDSIFFFQPQFLAEDPDGSLWVYVGNLSGFLRYDEDGWQVAQPSGADEGTLYTGLHFSGDQTWLINASRAMLEENGEQASFELGEYPFEGRLMQFGYDSQGHLWALEGFNTVRNLETGEGISYLENGTPLSISKFDFAPNGDLWLLNWGKVARYQGGAWTVFDHQNSILPVSNGLQNMVIDDNGHAWVKAYQKGLYRFDGVEWKHFSQDIFANAYISDMEAGPDGSIWLATWTNGAGNRIVRFDGQELQVISDPAGPSTLDFTREIFFDREENKLWFGGSGDVLYVFDGSEWSDFPLPFEVLNYQAISRIHKRGDHLAVASYSHLFIHDGVGWDIFNAGNSPMTEGSIYDMGLDPQGRIWLTHSSIMAIDIYQAGIVSTVSETPQAVPSRLEVWPNPVVDQLFISHSTANSSQITIEVFRADGALIRIQQAPATPGDNIFQISLEDLPGGSYWVVLTDGRYRKPALVVKR